MALTRLNNRSLASTAAITADKLDVGPLAGMRNRIINGDMRIDQRNAGAAVTNDASVATSVTNFITDRWKTYHYNLSGNFDTIVTSKQYQDHPKTSKGYCLRLDVTAAGTPSTSVDFLVFRQDIEASNCFDLYNVPMSLSFWVKTNNVGTYGVQLRAVGGVGSGSGNYITTYSISNANAWTYVTLSIPAQTLREINNGNGSGYTLYFTLVSGLNSNYNGGIANTVNQWGDFGSDGIAATTLSNNLCATVGNYFQITDIQLEKGSVATPFEHRQYGQELALCQRYCEILTGVNSIYVSPGAGYSSLYRAMVPLMVLKRATPTITIYGVGGYPNNPGKMDIDGIGSVSVTAQGRINGIFIYGMPSPYSGQCAYKAEAEL